MFRQVIYPALMMLVLMTLLVGVVYPLAVTGVANFVFPAQARGSLIYVDGKPVASALVGQAFDDPQYFWSRPSATAPVSYNAAASGGSNLGPSDPALVAAVKSRIDALRQADPEQQGPVPIDLVTTSASGLDPHISPAAAEFQAARVARARGLKIDAVRQVVAKHTQQRTFGLLGELRVHVVELNLALDQMPR